MKKLKRLFKRNNKMILKQNKKEHNQKFHIEKAKSKNIYKSRKESMLLLLKRRRHLLLRNQIVRKNQTVKNAMMLRIRMIVILEE